MSLRNYAMTMPLDTEADVIASAGTLIAMACGGWFPPVEVSGRVYRSLGQVACVGDQRSWVTVQFVRFARLLMECSERDRRTTVIHECAHVIQMKRDGVDDDHGPRWRALMRALGIPRPEVKCNVEMADPETRAAIGRNIVRRSLVVRCACDSFILSHQRARRARPLEKTCPKCGLAFSRVPTEEATRREETTR